MTRVVLTLCLSLLALPALAVEPQEMLDDPALEARAQDIGKEIRCLVCRNESIEDSNADLARDLRVVVRERISAGDTDDQVMSFLTDRYGDYVRLRPRFGGATLWVWLAGPLLLLLGAVIAWSTITRRTAAPDAPLTDAEQAALDDLTKHD